MSESSSSSPPCGAQTHNLSQEFEERKESVHAFEQQYVHEPYRVIAEHFSASRYKEWPKVASFLQHLPPGSLILDAGCGNGKYFECAQFTRTLDDHSSPLQKEDGEETICIRKKRVGKRIRTAENLIKFEKEWQHCTRPSRRFVIGTDFCRELLKLSFISSHSSSAHCSTTTRPARHSRPRTDSSPTPTTLAPAALPRLYPPPGVDVLCCDVEKCPFRPESFDAAICIAVIHHYSTAVRRREAIQKLLRLLRPGGSRVLIYVWALEKPPKASHQIDEVTGDAMIPWKMNQKFDEEKNVYQRFYHLFRKGELKTLAQEALSAEGIEGDVEKVYYDMENWCTVIRRDT